MKINVKNFLEYVNKATVNYTIDSFQLNYDKQTDTIWSRLKTPSMKVASIINMNNDILIDMVDDVQFNFNNPRENVKPYLNIFDDEEVALNLSDRKITLNEQVKLNFSDPTTISVMNKKNLENIDNYFVSLPVDIDFFNKFNKIKKIGNKFEMIYFYVEDGALYIESTDKTNPYSNGIKFKLIDVEHEDAIYTFNYKLFSQMMSIITSNDFTFSIAALEGTDDAGIIKVYNDNEQYYLISNMD